MVDTELLRDKIKESGFKHKYLADVLGVTPTTFSKKVNGATPFTNAEVYVMCDLLKLSEKEKTRIF